jgi:hypothetical protein
VEEEVTESAYLHQHDDDILSEQAKAQIGVVDDWLDRDVGPSYKVAPLAQDWARVAKVCEEAGEAIKNLIGATGQNPRKGISCEIEDVFSELADAWCSAMFGIQHFTKDTDETERILRGALEKAYRRAVGAPVQRPRP